MIFQVRGRKSAQEKKRVEASRLETKGFGSRELNLVADNMTPDGRERKRRVKLVIGRGANSESSTRKLPRGNVIMKPQRLRHFAVVALLVLAACGDSAKTNALLPEVAKSQQALFNNGGFESGAFAPDWTVSTFLNNSGLAAAPFPPQTVANLQLAAGGWNITKIVTGVPTESQVFAGMVNAPGVPKFPKFGLNSAVINELSSSTYGFPRSANSLKQNYVTTSADVDPSDNTIHVRFVLAPALQAASHAPQLQPYFFVVLRNQTAPRVGDLYTTFNFSNSPGTPWSSRLRRERHSLH